MASHVVVIDSTARRATVKVTPAKHLSDVLGEACAKLGLDATQYGLKHQKKQVDLSLSIRLSGLSSGAKLELVQLSRSPSVVSIALQLPESEAKGVPGGRLMDKFPSSTTLWLVLRKFESGVAGNGTTRNLTARGAPNTTSGTSGSGRLFYETPVIQLVGRELSSFTDLQRTLAQLGLNSGSALLRLSFRTTDRPLEEAMSEIDAYFKSVDAEETPLDKSPPVSETPISSGTGESARETTSQATPSNTDLVAAGSAAIVPESSQSVSEEPQHPLVSSRPVTIFAPPSSTTPQSAQTPYNEEDYIPTVDHAKAHQHRLNLAGRNKRLAGDAELAAQESAVKEKLAKVTEVEVKVRFPDQSQVVSKFNREDTAGSLHAFVRSCLDAPLAKEEFSLSFFPNVSHDPVAHKGQVIIPDTPDKFLIADLRMNGRVLVNFLWKDHAALAARSAGVPLLLPELREKASQIKVKDVAAVPAEGREEDKRSWLRKLGDGGDKGGKKGGGGGVPKWLKLPGKK
ncbi:UBX domain-containing protein [Coccidioides immitis RS]|uniref:UBX domain-containing protein n=1 Tax=Coccidioides immitis (strain RS) TaxID=246410 RepID=J3K2K9_COCIM|nr:UBX domain-containing protein [Coccidioides immitis RS]EAS28331.3 UBX domain-containing protein [Coccidioides immitis RS]